MSTTPSAGARLRSTWRRYVWFRRAFFFGLEDAANDVNDVGGIVGRQQQVEVPRDILRAVEAMRREDDEDSVSWPGDEGGWLRFRYRCEYVHGRLVREYFEREFTNPDQALVVRVSEPAGETVYETAPTPTGQFEVKRDMESPSFKGLKLFRGARKAQQPRDRLEHLELAQRRVFHR